MSGHRKWSEVRDEQDAKRRQPSPARHRAQRKFDRKIRWRKRWYSAKKWLGFE